MILAIRGIKNKKIHEKHARGDLKLRPVPLRFKGSTEHLKRFIASGPTWDTEEAHGYTELGLGQVRLPALGPHSSPNHSSNNQSKDICGEVCTALPLNLIACPVCETFKHCSNFSLLRGNTFSNVTCIECGNTTSSKGWRCECFNLWYKCSLHRHMFSNKPRLKAKAKMVKTKTKLILTNRPAPKRRQVDTEELCRTRLIDESIRGFKLDPTICPRLAAKFPHLARLRGGGAHGVVATPNSFKGSGVECTATKQEGIVQDGST